MTVDADAGWAAQPIAAAFETGSAPMLRRWFQLERPASTIAHAWLRVTALGTAELALNGRPVSGDVLEPGWSSYQWRLRYRTYDVAEMLSDSSVLAAMLGNGWYRGRLGWTGARAVYGEQRSLVAQLDIGYADGHAQRLVTDESWEAAPSPVMADDLYDGQTIDARRPGLLDACSSSSMNDWSPVMVVDQDLSVLVPATAPPVRRTDELAPISVERRSADRYIIDFGQNLVGWVRVQVHGPAGHEVVLQHSEVLEHGELALRPLRSAQACDRFILSGGHDVFEPTFTFHGFRYVEVTGWPAASDLTQLRAVVVHSDLAVTGTFRCSNELVNRLHENIRWSTRGNFLALPTDCPQRDERLGWTGDISVFAPTAAFLFDVGDFLSDWLQDLAAEQRALQGRVPLVVPNLFGLLGADAFPPLHATAIWGDAAVWVPWALWQAYGDRERLASHYDSMVSHVRHVLSLRSSRGLVDGTRELGDWLDPDAPADMPWQAKTDSGVVATACLYRSARLTAEAAGLLGRDDDARELSAAAQEVRTAFQRHYVQHDGHVHSDAVTGYALAIVFGLLDEGQRLRAGDRLAELVEAADFHITTGFAGTPFVCDALTSCGNLDHAYRLLLQQTAPSWLHAVTLGATTVWERWDSLLPDGTINPGEMTSFNHYALGAVADWMHRVVGGVASLEPGYDAVLVAPQPGGDITWATTNLQTRRGRISVSWQLDDGVMRTTVELPAGMRARLAPGGAEPRDVVGGVHQITGPGRVLH